MNTPNDDRHGDVLARLLHEEADRIVPAGDGLTRIRERVARRRSHSRWLIPSASVVTAAALAAAVFGVYNGLSGNGHPARLAQSGPSGTSSVTGNPTTAPATTTPVDRGGPVTPVWPFSTQDQVNAWIASYRTGGHSPWHLDPRYTATAFIDALGVAKQPVTVVGTSQAGANTLQVRLALTTTQSGQPHEFGTVTVTRWGTDKNAPWEVTGVTTAGATIDSPSAGATISSPLAMHYTLNGGAEDDVLASVWDAGGQLGSTHTVTGGGTHQISVPFGSPSAAVGFVVMADVQTGSGIWVLSRLAVTPVRFNTTSFVDTKYPPYFVAVRDGRLAVFYSKLGGFDRWLTPRQPGGPVSAPQLSADGKWVYFLQATGPSAQDLRRVSINGGPAQTVVDNSKGDVMTFAIGGDHSQYLAYATRGSGGAQNVVWKNTDTGTTGGFNIAGMPPAIEQLAWAPDGRHLAAQIRTGNMWGLWVYDTQTATSWNSGLPVPCKQGSACSAVSFDKAGNLYFVDAASASTWQLQQYTGTDVKHVSDIIVGIPGNSPEGSTVDITPDAYAALVSTGDGRIYRVVNGQAIVVTTNADQATW